MITALCTPLTDDESLHVEGLDAHIQDQLNHGISGLLVGGTMGAMQLLSMDTYQQLVQKSIAFNRGRAELLVGVGETGYHRTLERIRMVEEQAIDGVVVVTPYCFKFRQPDLIHYFQSLADVSKKPLFLYDLPQMTGSKLELETVRTLRKHPNIRGIKCSDHFTLSRPLLDEANADFRVIIAQPQIMDILMQGGVREHLDGMLGIAPHWTQQLVKAAERGDWAGARQIQQDFSQLLNLLLTMPVSVLAAANEILNARGIPGNIAPAPMQRMTAAQRAGLVENSLFRKAIQNGPQGVVG